jgi:hypothetical protein
MNLSPAGNRFDRGKTDSSRSWREHSPGLPGQIRSAQSKIVQPEHITKLSRCYLFWATGPDRLPMPREPAPSLSAVAHGLDAGNHVSTAGVLRGNDCVPIADGGLFAIPIAHFIVPRPYCANAHQR